MAQCRSYESYVVSASILDVRPINAFYRIQLVKFHFLTHWGRVTHICVFTLIIIGSDNGLLPGRRQAIIWTNDGILFIGP